MTSRPASCLRQLTLRNLLSLTALSLTALKAVINSNSLAGEGGLSIDICSVFPGLGLSMVPHLRFVHTRDVDLAILLSDAFSIEIFPSFQITTAGNSDNV
jgi:hypothetical protein